MQGGFVTLLGSPITQAFLGAALTAYLIHFVSGSEYFYVFGFGGRDGGAGFVVAVVFLGILGYRLGEQYIGRLPKR
jgi:hypothetical protein